MSKKRRQHNREFKAKVGLLITETPRDQAFCAYTILRTDTLEVEDVTKDAEKEVQEFTDKFIQQVEKHLSTKEKEIMSV